MPRRACDPCIPVTVKNVVGRKRDIMVLPTSAAVKIVKTSITKRHQMANADSASDSEETNQGSKGGFCFWTGLSLVSCVLKLHPSHLLLWCSTGYHTRSFV